MFYVLQLQINLCNEIIDERVFDTSVGSDIIVWDIPTIAQALPFILIYIVSYTAYCEKQNIMVEDIELFLPSLLPKKGICAGFKKNSECIFYRFFHRF